MKSTSEPLIVIDRRHSNPDRPADVEITSPAPELVKTAEPEPSGDKNIWVEVLYMWALQPVNPQVMIIKLRAVGERGDGKPFIADVPLLPTPPEDMESLRDEAKRRLDTFLGCECTYGAEGTCRKHRNLFREWQEAFERQNLELGKLPVPRCLETLQKAEENHRRIQVASGALLQNGKLPQQRRR